VKLVAFIYHDVLDAAGADDSGFSGEDAASYKLPEPTFRRHLDLIAAQRKAPLRIGAPGDLADSTAGLVLTFDDGGASGVSRVADCLGARGWPGHFFVTSDYIDRSGFMSAADLRRLQAAGHVVGSHSASHPLRISQLPRATILAEWRDSCSRLADILGAPVLTASVPGGFYSRDVALAAGEAGIRVLFTSEPTNRVAAVGSVALIGRFSVTRRTRDAEIVSLANARSGALLGQQLTWAAKKLVKSVGGNAWIRLRKKLFELGIG